MNNIIIDENNMETLKSEVLTNKPSRFDMAINFYCLVKKDNINYLVTYFYNPTWNLYYPFYDDINKTPIIQESSSNTYDELLQETNALLNISLKQKENLALTRFNELIGSNCNIIKSPINHIMYEIKFSKTTGKYTIYKLFNYIITSVEDINKVLNSKTLPCKLFNMNNLDDSKIVKNAISFINSAKPELIKYAINI